MKIDQSIIDRYTSRYPHLATLARHDITAFAQNALLLAAPNGIDGKMIHQLMQASKR